MHHYLYMIVLLCLCVFQFLFQLLKDCSEAILADFYRHCYTCMLQEISRGLPVHGFAIFIQVSICQPVW